MLDFFKLPGFKEAAEAQAVARELPFLGVPITIAGIEVLPLTLRRFTILSRGGSPWIAGGTPTDEDALVFLWVVSQDYEFAKSPPKSFMRRFARGWNDDEHEKLNEYVRLTFVDSNGGDNRDVSKVSAAAWYVHKMATAYHWSRDQILDTPMSELNQYLRCQWIEEDRTVVNNLTDRVKGDFLVELNKRPVEDRESYINELMEGAA